MAPTVRIDDQVYAWLQEQAKPFEDTPNSVLRRIAGLDATDGSSGPGKKRTFSRDDEGAGAQKTPQHAYRAPLLKILKKHGGQASRAQVLRELESMLGKSLTAHDRKKIKTGAVRWERTAEWEARLMREDQLIQPVENTARGVWALTPKGMEAAGKL
ncbi:MAG: hypothetical protein A2Z64_10260 [Betaproteobacteria bacterium RIFCSPLOWO2_02_67_12]|nr:MAG: hypothetical protein A2Z64_10260 [Betaproteobacteria bacterium RIFCSPLOWO2_02_67_12]